MIWSAPVNIIASFFLILFVTHPTFLFMSLHVSLSPLWHNECGELWFYPEHWLWSSWGSPGSLNCSFSSVLFFFIFFFLPFLQRLTVLVVSWHDAEVIEIIILHQWNISVPRGVCATYLLSADVLNKFYCCYFLHMFNSSWC